MILLRLLVLIPLVLLARRLRARLCPLGAVALAGAGGSCLRVQFVVAVVDVFGGGAAGVAGLVVGGLGGGEAGGKEGGAEEGAEGR